MSPMANRIRVLKLTKSERRVLEERARSQTLPKREVERARIVLLSADGKRNAEIRAALGVSRTKVQRWLDRYEESGSVGVRTDRPRSGGPKTITAEQEAEIVRLTVAGPPKDKGTHWSTRTLAPAVGVSPASVGRIWKAHGLQPHRTKTFKLSNDPKFVEKLHDVVGLYVNPPERAVVLSVDEKSQVQALDRTQPGLPLKKGRAGTMTHDYKRHGTTTLFAALNVASGEVLGDCQKRHRHQEFLRFMRSVVKTVDRKLDIHVILDNYATHKHPKVKAWLAKNPRVHFHFIPTSSSWLNLVERFFGELSQRQLKRLAVTSVDQLVDAITAYIARRNEDPKPFVWTASVQHILEKVTKARASLESLH